MQLKEEYIRFLTAYKPILPAAVERLVQDTPHWQQPELRMALEYMGISIPPRVLIAPKLTVENLLGYCDPYEVEFKESEEDHLPHFWPKVNFTLNFWHVSVSPGIAIADRRPVKRPVYCLIKLPSNKIRVCFDDVVAGVTEIEVDDSSDDLQRIRVYKLL